MYANEVVITDDWYVPHFQPRPHNPREAVMLGEWKKYMQYEDEHAVGWCTRLAAFLSDIPRALNLRGGRMAATSVVWFVTPGGISVLDQVLKKTKGDSENKIHQSFLESDVVATWAVANKLNHYTRNYLEHLLLKSDGNPVYHDPPYPTMEDNRVVEAVLIFLAKGEGRKLLRRVCNRSDQLRLTL